MPPGYIPPCICLPYASLGIYHPVYASLYASLVPWWVSPLYTSLVPWWVYTTRVHPPPTHPGYTHLPHHRPHVHGMLVPRLTARRRAVEETLGSRRENPLGGLTSWRSGAKKCLPSYVFCARNLCSPELRNMKDWIARGA